MRTSTFITYPDARTAWQNFHDQAVPIYHRVKGFGHANIFRFHVLPDSRMTAQDHQEIREMLDRYNAIASDVLTNDRPCWMIVAEWSVLADHQDHVPDSSEVEFFDLPETPREAGVREKRECLNALRRARIRSDFDLKPAWEFHDPEDSELVWKIYAGLVTWRPGRFDKLLRRIYHENAFSPLWMNAETGALFAPYHAGVDVAVPETSDLLDMIDRHADMAPVNGYGQLWTPCDVETLPEGLRKRWLQWHQKLFQADIHR